jgi:hypothetical protein
MSRHEPAHIDTHAAGAFPYCAVCLERRASPIAYQGDALDGLPNRHAGREPDLWCQRCEWLGLPTAWPERLYGWGWLTIMEPLCAQIENGLIVRGDLVARRRCLVGSRRSDRCRRANRSSVPASVKVFFAPSFWPLLWPTLLIVSDHGYCAFEVGLADRDEPRRDHRACACAQGPDDCGVRIRRTR